jgi:hypothetical protein
MTVATTIGSNPTTFNRNSGPDARTTPLILRIYYGFWRRCAREERQMVSPASGAVSSQASLPKVGTSTPMLLAMEMRTLVGLVLGSCR